MKYLLSAQYAKGDEKPLAAFNSLNDAIFFINGKIAFDDTQSIKLIYRIYDNGRLAQEFNKNKISIVINNAIYAEGDRDIRDEMYVPFKVIMKVVDGTEHVIARFNNKDDAHLFIVSKCNNDSSVGLNVVFYIYEMKSLVDELSKSILAKRKAESETAKGSEKKVVFRPTPLPNKLRLGPGAYFIEEDDKDKDE